MPLWGIVICIIAGALVLWFLWFVLDGDANWLLSMIASAGIGAAITEWVIEPDVFFLTFLWVSAAVMVVSFLVLLAAAIALGEIPD